MKLRPDAGSGLKHNIGILVGSLYGGGAERVAMRLFCALTAHGASVYLILLDGNRDFEPAGLDADQRSRIIHLTRADVGRNTLAKLLVAPWQWVKLQITLRRLGVRVLVSLQDRCNIVNLLSGRRIGRVLSVRSDVSMALAAKDPLKRLLVKLFYRFLTVRADKIVFNSRGSAASFRRRFPAGARTSEVIYNFFDATQPSSAATNPLAVSVQDDFPGGTVVTCGRLNPEKGHWHLIRAFSAVSSGRGEIGLVIIGKGRLEPALRRLAEEIGIAGRVVFVGFDPQPMAWFTRASMFVLPSVYEGFPNALLEAMAGGLSVIATDCSSGPRELLAPGTPLENKAERVVEAPFGLLTPPLDGIRRAANIPLVPAEACLAEAMNRLFADAERRSALGRAAAARAREFSVDRLLPEWLRVIEQVA